MTLPRQQPTVVTVSQFAANVFITFDIDLSHAQGDITDRFVLSTQLGPQTPILAEVAADRIRLVRQFGWIVSAAEYLGPAPVIRADNGAILEPFTTPVPFP